MKKLFLFILLMHFLSGASQTKSDSLRQSDILFLEELYTCPLPAVKVGANYPGGINNFQKELKEKLSKASVKKLNRLKQNSYLNFTVERDGSLSDISISSSNNAKLIADIKQSIKLIPKWFPAIENGKPLCVQISLLLIPE